MGVAALGNIPSDGDAELTDLDRHSVVDLTTVGCSTGRPHTIEI
jgi:hypothetical protein